MEYLIVAGVDVSHIRLVDLTRLADQAKPFYEWIEIRFQQSMQKVASLHELLLTAAPEQIKAAMMSCYYPQQVTDTPLLFDGIGRTYSHHKACYYFFSWIIRDAPQQRLAPLVQQVMRASGQSRIDSEIEVLSALICKYRANVKTFTWDAVREVIIDRLEGSRRSIQGHNKELVVRMALITAIQTYFKEHSGYGIYAHVEVPAKQVIIHNETYDVSANLLDEAGRSVRRILIAIKSRETEGGGHSHLFSRDILSAVTSSRAHSPQDYILAIIIANQWSPREAENLRAVVDHIIVFKMHPDQFSEFDSGAQTSFNTFIERVFDGKVLSKGKL